VNDRWVEVLRRRVAERARGAGIAERIRAFYYPKQRAFYTSKAKRRATRKTRRSGATTGGCRELLARALEQPRFRATYCHSTRIEAKALAWESDTQGGLVDLLREYGTKREAGGVTSFELDGVLVEVREADLILEFSNGSQIDLFGADDERAIEKQRGRAKHVYWVDEAQKFRFLSKFVKAIASPALADFDGELWLTGTPDRDCAGYFYDVTKDYDPAAPPLAGWDVHSLAVVDNPFFGATEQERWDRTAGAALIENGWTVDEPDFQREWLARWISTDARFVYAAHAVPLHELTFAPARLDVDGFPDIRRALLDLPEYESREYFLAMGADLGTRDAFAFVIWGWSLKDPVLYEVCSWSKPGLDYDEMAAYLNAARQQAVIGMVVADAGGGGKPAVMGWSKRWVDRYQIPIIEATKVNKHMAIGQLNTDIRKRRCRVRSGGTLLAEWLIHKWAPLRSVTGLPVESTTPNHASDAGLYAHRESYHHRWRPAPQSGPEINTPEWVLREEIELEHGAMEDEG
jgi:hypothetical protein